jgi:hypothetical protein
VSRKSRVSRLGVEPGESYALVHEEVMNSAAYGAMPDFSKAVMFALACRYQGHNNGDLSLPFSEAHKLGVAHQWKLYAGLQLLRKAGLVEMTRQGKLERGTKVCSLYSVTWRGIDDPPAGVTYDAGIAAKPLPSNDWVRWTRPANWAAIVREVTNAHHGKKKPSRLLRREAKRRSTAVGAMAKLNPVSTTVGAGRSTAVGAMEPKTAQPAWVLERGFVAPTLVDTSKTPPSRTVRSNGSESPPIDLASARRPKRVSKNRLDA